VLWWGVNQNIAKQVGSLFKMLQDPVNEDLPTDIERDKEQQKAKLGLTTMSLHSQIKKKKGHVRAKSGGISLIAIWPITFLMYLILGLIWLLHFVPSAGPLDKIIGWVRKLDPFLSSSLGDVERYTDHEIWSANVRSRVE
jgi:hypothetical protein